jgi:signal transduction histidine kinase
MSKFLLALLIVGCCSAQALTLMPQSGVHEAASLFGHLAALRDASGQLEIEAVAAPAKADDFVALPGFLGAGYTADSYWLRFTLQRTVDTSAQWFLEVAPPYLNEVTLFVASDDGGFVSTHMGSLQPYAERPVPHRNFVFPIRLSDEQPVTFYLRVKTKSSMLVRVVAWQYPGLLAATQTDTSLYSAYFGLLALGFISNLVFWFWLREHVYRNYCAYLLALAVVMMSTGGFVAQWLFPHFPLLANRTLGVAVCMLYLLGTQFFIDVLCLREHFPRLGRLFDSVLLFYAGCALAALAGYYIVIITWLNLVGVVATSGVAVAGYGLLWRGHREYLLYTLAFTASFSGLALTLARLTGCLSAHDAPTDYTVMLSTTLHVLLTNIAVADRVRRSDRDKLIAEKQTALLTAEYEAHQQQRQFIAMVSHEFRTPLAVIDATAQSVEIVCAQMSSALVGAILPRQEKIRRAVRSMVSLLDNFLTNERLDFREAERQAEAVDLRDLASEAAKSWQHLLHTPDQLRLEWPNEPATVLADRAMLLLALSNLIDNAIKYALPGSPIRLRVGKTNVEGWIEVENSGAGILPEELEKIFGKFYRSNQAKTVPGAGLGLFLVRTLLRQHGGEVEVSSEPGKETRFRLCLPLAK